MMDKTNKEIFEEKEEDDLEFLNLEEILEDEPDFVDDEVDHNEINLEHFFGE
jgi:hypothetical protein